MVTPEQLTELSKVCLQFGIQHLKTPDVEIVINPNLQQSQKMALDSMSKKEIEELLYSST